MATLRLGILGCSDIAQKRFMPALMDVEGIEAVAIAEQFNMARVDEFVGEFPLEVEPDFPALLARDDIDAVYVPQPPALHLQWAEAALKAGKHVLVEKPSTTCLADTMRLVDAARERGLALHENYMFQYHSQIAAIRALIDEGVIGDVRLYRADFGFPMRQANDFRYVAKLGGGALLDAGGYVLKLGALLLGPSARIATANVHGLPGYEVDMMGSFTMEADGGLVYQGAFGMDCGYRCKLEVWGSTGTLTTDRIFTAPNGFEPSVVIQNNEGVRTIKLEADAHFTKSIAAFVAQTRDAELRQKSYEAIAQQARLVEDVRSAVSA